MREGISPSFASHGGQRMALRSSVISSDTATLRVRHLGRGRVDPRDRVTALGPPLRSEQVCDRRESG